MDALIVIKEATKSYRKIIFVSVTKIGENTTNILTCYFLSEIPILAHQTKYLQAAKRIKFASHKQYLFGLLFTIKLKKTRIDLSTLQVF